LRIELVTVFEKLMGWCVFNCVIDENVGGVGRELKVFLAGYR
jgi:hypothetical protein